MHRLNSLLDEYNSGAHDIDKLFDDLVELEHDLTDKEQRSVKENLSEDKLTIFDLLLKEKLAKGEIEQVKKNSKSFAKKASKGKTSS